MGGIGNCPICLEEMQLDGLRTVVYSFDCAGGQFHAVCRACDRRLFSRWHDSCPICRAPRTEGSIESHGSIHRGARPQATSAVLETLLNLAEAPPVRTIFFPIVEPELIDPSMVVVAGGLRVHRDELEPLSEEDASNVLNNVLQDPGVVSAMEGLRNAANIPLRQFVENLRRARGDGPRPNTGVTFEA